MTRIVLGAVVGCCAALSGCGEGSGTAEPTARSARSAKALDRPSALAILKEDIKPLSGYLRLDAVAGKGTFLPEGTPVDQVAEYFGEARAADFATYLFFERLVERKLFRRAQLGDRLTWAPLSISANGDGQFRALGPFANYYEFELEYLSARPTEVTGIVQGDGPQAMVEAKLTPAMSQISTELAPLAEAALEEARKRFPMMQQAPAVCLQGGHPVDEAVVRCGLSVLSMGTDGMQFYLELRPPFFRKGPVEYAFQRFDDGWRVNADMF